MPKKTSVKKTVKKAVIDEDGEYDDFVEVDQSTDSDDERLVNSDDEYSDTSSEDSEQSGGESEDAAEESDNESIDVDSDDENDQSIDDYNPIEDETITDAKEADADGSDNTDAEETDGDDADVDDDGDDGDDDGAYGNDDGAAFEAESKDCHMKNIKKDKDKIILDGDDSTIYAKLEYQRIPDTERISDKYMTYYEFVRIIGIRAQHFNLGAKPLVKGIDHLAPPKMAYVELISKMTPFIVRRHLPNKKYEEWKIHEMEIIHEIDDDYFVPENFEWSKFILDNKKSLQSLQSVELFESSEVDIPDKSTTINQTEAARPKQQKKSNSKTAKKSNSKTSKKTAKSKSQKKNSTSKTKK